MGSEQSQQQQQQQQQHNSAGILNDQSSTGGSSNVNTTGHRVRPNSTGGINTKLQRGNTIATPGASGSTGNGLRFTQDGSPIFSSDSRPVSPPISVCSDSDLPYISYTDRPIGDSPKLRNKGQTTRNARSGSSASIAVKKQLSLKTNIKLNTAHNIVVVKAATKDPGIDKDPEIVKLQNIPMFLPVMRGTLSLPANRDPEVLERLQPIHLSNMCSRLQAHYNASAHKVSAEQAVLTNKVKEIDQDISKLIQVMIEKQKLYSTYAEHFSKVKTISQQLCRCNTLLNQNIESLEQLNNMLDLEDRLEPFVWKTEC